MAIAKGVAVTSNKVYSKYIGVGSVKILCVNPTKEEMKKVLGIDAQNDSLYTASVDVEGKPQKNVRITFWIETIPEENDGISTRTQLTFFLQDSPRFNRDRSKCQVIDKYGRTAWVTNEQFSSRQVPIYSNGKPANIDSNYRQAYIGEEALTQFLINYLNLPSPTNYINGEWVMKEDPSGSECRLDNIKKYFDGDVSELKEIISWNPNQSVKVLFGINKTSDGKEYQRIYPSAIKGWIKDYTKLNKEIEEKKMQGGLNDFIYEICDLKEYVVTPTSFNNQSTATSTPSEDLPW